MLVLKVIILAQEIEIRRKIRADMVYLREIFSLRENEMAQRADVHQQRKEAIEASRKNNQVAATCVEGCENTQGNLSLPVHVTFDDFISEECKWSLTNTGAYSQTKSRVQWTACATRTCSCHCPPDVPTGTYIVDGVVAVQNKGKGNSDLGNAVINFQTLVDGVWVTQYSAVQSKFLTGTELIGNVVPGSSGVITETSFTESPNATLVVTNKNGEDVFRSSNPNALVVKANSIKWFAFQAKFVLPLDFLQPVRIQVLFTFDNAGAGCEPFIGNNIAYQGGLIKYNNVKTLAFLSGVTSTGPPVEVNQTVKIETSNLDTSVDSGTYKCFTTEIGLSSGVVGREFISDSQCFSTCILPCPEAFQGTRTFSNSVRIYTDDRVVVFDLPRKPGSDKTIRFQFVNAPGVWMEVAAPVLVNGECMAPPPVLAPIRKYSPQDWAANVDDILRLQWVALYAPLGGLRLVADNGIVVLFTDCESVILNLDLFTRDSGKITVSATNPGSTSGVSDLAALLWLKLTLDHYPGLSNEVFTSGKAALNLPLNAQAGDEPSLYALDGLTYGQILIALINFVLSASPSDAVVFGGSKGKNVKREQNELLFVFNITNVTPTIVASAYDQPIVFATKN
jgi:hypothetical protein